MKKHFRKPKKFRIKLLIFTLLVISSFYLSFDFLYRHFKDNIKKEDIIKYLIYGDSNVGYENLYNLNSTEFLIRYSLGISLDKSDTSGVENNQLGDYVEDPSMEIITNPVVYIYNTHQSES